MSNSVLIIDDSSTIRERIIKTLESTDLFSRYYEAEDGLEGFKKLLSAPVDIILCDLEMPRIDGFKFLSMLKSRPDLQDVPVLILTGMNDRELKIKGLDQGASDYITKPFDPEELIARVKVHLKIKNLQDDLKRSNELLLELSNTDHLTGLFNRRYMMEALDKEVQRSVRKNGPLSLIMLDIDHFKQVNDTYGHEAGDLLLKSLAGILLRESRRSDIACRFGGEEFCVIMPGVPMPVARQRAEAWRKSFAEFSLAYKHHTLRATLSIGIAIYPDHGNTGENILHIADGALYTAKQAGRNRVEIAPLPTV